MTNCELREANNGAPSSAQFEICNSKFLCAPHSAPRAQGPPPPCYASAMPPIAVVSGTTQCSFSTGPAPMGGIPVPGASVIIEGKPALTLMDQVPMFNIMPMVMCLSPLNPMGMGLKPPAVPIPTACIPIPVSPWLPPGPPIKPVTVNGKPILLSGSTCQCVWGGTIQIAMPGTFFSQANIS